MGKSRSKPSAINLTDLKDAFKDQLQEQERERERQRKAKAEAHRLEQARAREANLFREEIADVTPLSGQDRKEPNQKRPAPVPRQRELDDRDVLAASLSDDIDLGQYLDTDDSLSYTAPGVGPDIAARLRRGAWAISAQVDLHGLRRDEAREVLVDFLDECRLHTKRCVRVIHGKGLGSVNREPVLKDKVRKWLVQRPEVLAFCQTRPDDGGSGALLVLLAGRQR